MSQASIPASFSIIISVDDETLADVQGVIEGDQSLLLGHEIRVARGIARLHAGKTEVMMTNFSQEFKHLNKRTTIADLQNIVETSNAFVRSDSPASASTTVVPETDFAIDPGLHISKHQELKSLLRV